MPPLLPHAPLPDDNDDRFAPGPQDDSDWEPQAVDAHTIDISELGTTLLVPPELKASVHAEHERQAAEHEREAERADRETLALRHRLEADRAALHAAHERYLAQLRQGVGSSTGPLAAALRRQEAEVAACRERVAADNAALDACRRRAHEHHHAAVELRWLIWHEQQG